ncbi:fibroblast growth factor 8 [Hydra vulgaris]|uniref:fibroblast growth factor 8 n=1 Tax=Hydra vulgaris TaxID=6087 RepID=UPI000640EA4E|nr:fibroblast growth factor 8 [Hydra vulgaris]
MDVKEIFISFVGFYIVNTYSEKNKIDYGDLIKEHWEKTYWTNLDNFNCVDNKIVSEKSVRLRSFNGNKFLQISKNKVRVSNIPLQNTNITIETIGHDLIRIKGCKANRYICFNEKSKLIVQENGDHDNCVFEEKFITSNIVCYKSKFKDWYLGIKDNGKIQRGNRILYSSKERETRLFFIEFI